MTLYGYELRSTFRYFEGFEIMELFGLTVPSWVLALIIVAILALILIPIISGFVKGLKK